MGHLVGLGDFGGDAPPEFATSIVAKFVRFRKSADWRGRRAFGARTIGVGQPRSKKPAGLLWPAGK
jgi:hypothetical protein